MLAKNYLAKTYDIKTGEAIWQAKLKCRDLIVVPPNFPPILCYNDTCYLCEEMRNCMTLDLLQVILVTGAV